MSFFWFSDKIFRYYLKAKFKNSLATEHDFGTDRYKKLHQINRCFSSSPWGMQHDITDHVAHPFDIKTKTRYRFSEETRSFGEVCLDTANKISAMTDRPIAVSWSGGIDSTAALVALLQILPADRLTVVCTKNSIEEFPSFYDHKIRDRLRVVDPGFYARHYQDFFAVSGDGGDAVWGVIDDSFWLTHSTGLHDPWQDCIDKNIMSDIDFIEEFCSWSGTDITTWLDLRVWFYICCKWQDKCMRPYYLRRGLTPRDTIAFYDTDTFQHWTMSNRDKIIGDTWQDYKVPAKQFIYEYHGDMDYFRHKTKVCSILQPDLMTKSNHESYWRIAVREDFSDHILPSWPFVDYAELEDFNDSCHLIPPELLLPRPGATCEGS